jgi:hypothetical protein
MKLLPAILLLASCSTLCAGEKLHRATMHDIVTQLRVRGIPVCFEQCTSKPEDAVTIKQEMALVGAIPDDQRTDHESELLAVCKRLLDAGMEPEMTVTWRQTEFDFDFPSQPFKTGDVLDAAVKEDASYQWKQIDGRYVVFPRGDSFNQPLAAFSAANLALNEFLAQVKEQVATPAKLNDGLDGAGYPWWWGTIKDHTISLTLKDTDTRTALTLIANRLGPDVIWSVLASGEDRDLSFYVVFPNAPGVKPPGGTATPAP